MDEGHGKYQWKLKSLGVKKERDRKSEKLKAVTLIWMRHCSTCNANRSHQHKHWAHRPTPPSKQSFPCLLLICVNLLFTSGTEHAMTWRGGRMFSWNSRECSSWWEENTSQYKGDNPVPALPQIALIWDIKGDGDVLYSEWQAHHCKGIVLKRIKLCTLHTKHEKSTGKFVLCKFIVTEEGK